MQKHILLLLLLVLAGSLWSIPIGWVEDLEIDSSEFQDKINELPDTLTIPLKKELALESLVEDKLLLLYSYEQQIDVSQEEIDALFIKAFSDHPLFMSEGEFSYEKYEQARTRPAIQEILSALEKDIRIEKTRDLLYKKLELNDDELLDRFFLENLKMDISYALFDLDDVAVPSSLSSAGAIDYYYQNQDIFTSDDQIKLGFLFIPYSDFDEKAEENLQEYYQEIDIFDYILQSAITDSIDHEYLREQVNAENEENKRKAKIQRMRDLALEEAELIKYKLERDIPVSYPQISSGFVSLNTPAGSIPKEIIESGFLLNDHEISDPTEMASGFLLYWKIDVREGDKGDLDRYKDIVWDTYRQTPAGQINVDQLKKQYNTNVDAFKVKVYVINRIDLETSMYGRTFPLVYEERSKALDLLLRRQYYEEYLEKAADKLGLPFTRKKIIAETYLGNDAVDDQIVAEIEDGKFFGVAEVDGKEAFFVLREVYPEFVPDFDFIVNSEIFEIDFNQQYNEEDIKEYYNAHIKDFYSPDSVRVKGVSFPLEIDSVTVDTVEVIDYYEKHREEFYHDNAIDCRFILTEDKARAELASMYLSQGYDYDLIRWCYHDSSSAFEDGMVEYYRFDDKLKEALMSAPEGKTLSPYQTEQGWLVVTKLKEIPKGYFALEEVYENIEHELLMKRADSLAYANTRAVYDSVSTYSECRHFVDEKYMFSTPFMSIEEEFPVLGSLQPYKKQLLRLYYNEKLTQVVKAVDGYAIVFMSKKSLSDSLGYDKSKPEVEAILDYNLRLEVAKSYVDSLISSLKSGKDADSLLYFFGGLHQMNNLTLTSSIPGFEHSRILIEDMMQQEAGYYSPVLQLAENQLMFYRIDAISKVSKKEFSNIERDYKYKILEKDYHNWLKNYKQDKTIQLLEK